MPYITHFTDPTGEVLPVAAGTFYTIRVPAATSTNTGNWVGSAAEGYSLRAELDGVTDEHIILPSGDDILFTACGLTVEYRDEALILHVVHLTSVDKTLAITVLNAYNGGEL